MSKVIHTIKSKLKIKAKAATLFSRHASSRPSTLRVVRRSAPRKTERARFSLAASSGLLRGSSLIPLPSSRTVSTNKVLAFQINNPSIIGPFGIWILGIAIFGLLISMIAPVYIIEAKTEAAVGTATESTISLSLSSNNIVLNLLQPGTYDANNLESGIFGSASTTASVSTTNYTGYTLSIAASSSTNAGKLIDSTNSDTTRNYFSSIESATSESVFSNSSNTSYNGKWGYKPSYYNSAVNSNYLPAPSTSGVTIEQTNTPNTTAKDYTITLGARANINQSAGSYSNTFNIVATANPVTYSVTYSDNSGDSSVANLPSVSASSLNAQSKLNTSTISLSSTIPTRTGYTFNKWCLGTVSNSGTTCTGTEYNAGADFGIDQTINNSSITLYAKWTINTYTCTKRYRLQNADGTYPSSYTSDGSSQINHGSTCSYSKSVTNYQTQSTSQANMTGAVTLSLSLPRNTYTLTINRNTTYISSVSGAGTYRWGQSVNISATAASNSTFTSWSQTSGATGSFASTTSASTTFIMPTSAATIYADGQAVTYMQDYTVQQCKSEASSNNKTVYDKRDNKAYTVRYINNACYMTQNLAYIGTSSDASGKMTLNVATSNIDTNKTLTYGDLALGDTYDSPRLRVPSDADLAENNGLATATQIGAWYNYAAATGGTITGSSNTETATYDICPKNWHIPTTTSPGSIYDVSSYATAFSPVVGGFYHQGYLHDAKVYGGWGSVVAYNSTTRSDLQYRDGSLSGYIFDRGGGFYVRCVRNDDKPYMQDYTLASCQSEASDANKAVKDKRDEKEYTVRYINGACWMIQNLRFASTSLNSSTTNMDVTKVFNYGDLTAGDTYTESRLHIPNSTNDSDALKLYSAEQLGYYYNYAAASAGTIATGTNYSNATYDVCPKNWRLPTSDEASGIISNMSSFSPILGGGYGGGSHGDTSSYGCWWTSTYGGSSVSMNRLVYESNGNSDVRGLGWGARNLGFYVRCVRTS